MTIRLGYTSPHRSLMNPRAITVPGNGAVLAYVDTDKEAEQAKRAFEQVLAPRFTRDEAIAVAVKALPDYDPFALESEKAERADVIHGIRTALEALAAAGVFVDSDVTIRDQSGNGNDLTAPTMADKLDAAGIR
jgi:hypothetical protein